MRSGRLLVVSLLIGAAAGCGVHLSGPPPVPQDAMALRVAPDATAEQVATLLTQQGAEIAILASTHDSTWYADVAKRANLKSTRTANTGTTTFAFLGAQALGDTTLSLKVKGGGELKVHDALYRIDKQRRLDLMAIKMDQQSDLREAVRSLLDYISTDINSTAAVVFAIEPPTPALGDSISFLIRAAFSDVWECTEAGKKTPRTTDLPLRMFYGPSMHIKCDGAQTITSQGNGLLAHVVVTQ